MERSGYWDCDAIGEPCQPRCGWPALQGYQFPEPNAYGLPWCSGLSFTDFLQVR